MRFFVLVGLDFDVELLKIDIIKMIVYSNTYSIIKCTTNIMKVLYYFKINFAVTIYQNRIWGKQDH